MGGLRSVTTGAERQYKTFCYWWEKNWLFSNTPAGARSSAIYYSLIVTTTENGLNPFEYLTWILTQMPNLGRPGYAASIEELLPGSTVLPEKVFMPKSKKEPKQYAWEEEQ